MGVGTFRVGTFVVVSDVCVFGRRRRGAYRWDRVGCTRGNGAHPWREVTPSRGWRHGRSAPRLRTTASGRRGGLNSVVFSTERSPTLTVSETCPFTNQGDANVRFFIRVRFCTVYLVIKLSPGTPLFLCVGAHILSSGFGAVKAYGASAATPKRAGCSDETVAVGSVHARERPASRRTDREHVERRRFRGEPRQRVSPETPQHGRARTDPRAPLTRDADVQARGNRIRDVLMDRSAARDPQDGTRTRRAARRPGVRRAGASGPRSQEDRRRVRGRPNHRQPPPGAGTPREARIRRRRVQTQPERIAERKRAGRGVGAMARAVRTRGQRGGHPRRASGESRLPQRKKKD